MIVVCDPNLNKLSLQPLCDELIVIEECEPDVGYELAFSIDFVGFKEMGIVGVGKSICHIKSTHGQLIRKPRTFISGDHKTRAMWTLRANGKTFDEIGELVNLNASNVLRALKGLPKPKKFKNDDEWIKHYLNSIIHGDKLDESNQS